MSPNMVADRPSKLGWLSALPPAALALAFLACLPTIAGGEAIRIAYDWVPSLGIRISFLLDGLSLTFALLISGIGAFVALYSSVYLAGHLHLGRFFFYLFFFMAAMLGLVLADNVITLFVFWELTTVASYLLIGFDHASAKARRSALQALLVTGAGGLALLAGLILLGFAAGSFELSVILTQGDLIRADALYLPILVLVLLGAFTKSAQVPFHFWLPNAMAAPTPVSAYLHSATMVKAGIYLLARMHPALSGTEVWIWSLTIFGAVTAVTASVLALRQTDLKLALAYTTVMALGTLTMFLGSEASVAVAAAVTFLMVHSFYKAALFMVVGIIDYRTGTREVAQLRGLAGVMPVTAVAAAAAALSMAGFPPFLGFIGKELKYEGALAIASEPMFVAGAAVLANALMVAVAGIVALRPFYGARLVTPKAPKEAPVRLWIGPLVLAALGLTFGLTPSLIADNLVQPAVTAILGRPEAVKLALWHGINLPLLLSVVTFALGLSVYFFHQPLRRILISLEARLPTTGDRTWDGLLTGLKALAAAQTRLLQSGILRRYLFVVFASLALAVGTTLIVTDAWRFSFAWSDLMLKHWAVVALIAAGAMMTAVVNSRLAAICALGVVGVGVAMLFVMFGAPDVAITQLLVETLVVVLVAVAMLRLPDLRRDPAPGFRGLDAVLALCVGAAVSATLLAVVAGPMDRSITTYFEGASVPEAFGHNIVNVILVDFRALDTFGEVAVVVVAALGAYALIRGTRRTREKSGGRP
ncbi:putative monovalent cation/H+ antiporter subunit A [Pelagibius litoralis]|uniref:Monovalent cation/H+ antiporter subunit A n=1 Tax=Pelagibius litoralis TaxID=374515 RepID=A0A967KCN4_9PROT|nr:putative monovalent cation/H+ antiporter subunit A [Pelagibius litoralis]NIA69765.1 putative monovalent cation/H+ antiporter subunit A [Pelagibius litoralis]